MHALVADVAVAGVPEPVPVVFEAQLVEGPHRRRSEEQVPVHAGRRRAVGLVADRGAALEAQALGHVDLADQAALQRLHGLDLEGHAAMLRADLQHALGLARDLQHLLAFVDVVAGRLFAVDVLARFHRPDGGQRVPVVGRGDRNRLDFGSANASRMSSNSLAFSPVFLQKRRLRFFARGLVDIAERDDARLRQLANTCSGGCAAAAESDDATLILSFAPQTRVAAAAVAAPRKNLREVESDMNLAKLLCRSKYIRAYRRGRSAHQETLESSPFSSERHNRSRANSTSFEWLPQDPASKRRSMSPRVRSTTVIAASSVSISRISFRAMAAANA